MYTGAWANSRGKRGSCAVCLQRLQCAYLHIVHTFGCVHACVHAAHIYIQNNVHAQESCLPLCQQCCVHNCAIGHCVCECICVDNTVCECVSVQTMVRFSITATARGMERQHATLLTHNCLERCIVPCVQQIFTIFRNLLKYNSCN